MRFAVRHSLTYPANPIRTAVVPFFKRIAAWPRRGDGLASWLKYAIQFVELVVALSFMVRVAILGASGYSALELMRILLRHPEVEITALTTRRTESRWVGEVHPALAGRLDVRLENLSTDEIARR